MLRDGDGCNHTSISTETFKSGAQQLVHFYLLNLTAATIPASALISAKPVRPTKKFSLCIRKVLETNSFFYPCTISNIRTYLDSYERLFTLRRLFPSPIEEIC